MSETLSQKELVTLLIDLSGGVKRCPHAEIRQEEMRALSEKVTRGTPYESVFIGLPNITVKIQVGDVASYE